MNIIKKTAHSLHQMGMKQYFWNLMINGILMSYLVPVCIRRYTLNILGANVKGAIHGHCSLLSSRLTLGAKSFINRNCFIDNNATVKIGNNCAIGYNVVIATSNHSMGCSSKRGGVLRPLPVEIQDGCWIGANSTILPGTIVQKGCVIAAGSIVKGICEANCLYAGVPATKKRDLPKDDEK